MDADSKLNSSALRWLYELESLDSPALKLNLYENVFLAHTGIKDCKIFITPKESHQKGILIWLKLKFLANILYKTDVYNAVTQVVGSLLPSFRVRIVDDESILELACKRAKETYGIKSDKKSDLDHGAGHDSRRGGKNGGAVPVPEARRLLPDSEEQAPDRPEVRDGPEQPDSEGDKQA